MRKKKIDIVKLKDDAELHYTQMFEQQLKMIKRKKMLKPGEQITQCLDKESFNGKCYCPKVAVTSYGRVWSISEGHIIKLNKVGKRGQQRNAVDTKRDTYRNIYIHHLVANYYCNKLVVNLCGEQDVEVHHIDGNRFNDRADNIIYILKEDHTVLTAMQKASKNRFDICTRILAKTAKRNGGKYRVIYDVDADGNLTKEFQMTVGLNNSRMTDEQVYEWLIKHSEEHSFMSYLHRKDAKWYKQKIEDSKGKRRKEVIQ